MKVYIQYISERFPFFPILLFSFGYSSLAIGITSPDNPWLAEKELSINFLLLFAAIFFFFLLRQRVMDEFKDAEHDLINFPDRPVPRGLITKKQLISLGIFALIFEWISIIFLGIRAVLIYLPVFFYSLLMAKEFFVSSWLNRHFTFYFLSHEVVFVLFGIFFILVMNPHVFVKITNSFLPIWVLSTAPVTVEIIRKFGPRYGKDGKVVADTYGTVWGRSITLSILIGLSFFMALAIMLIKNSYLFLLFGIINIIGWLIFGRKSDKVAILIGVINFLGFAILANLIW